LKTHRRACVAGWQSGYWKCARVYVGDYSSRVREYLWQQVKEGLGDEANAVLCFRSANESGFEVQTLGKNRREPVLYDGLQLIAFKPTDDAETMPH
jgi:CRISPR-associated protein Cas2